MFMTELNHTVIFQRIKVSAAILNDLNLLSNQTAIIQ